MHLGVRHLPREEPGQALLPARPDDEVDVLHRTAGQVGRDVGRGDPACPVSGGRAKSTSDAGDDVRASVVPDGERHVPGPTSGLGLGVGSSAAAASSGRRDRSPLTCSDQWPAALARCRGRTRVTRPKRYRTSAARSLADVVGRQDVDAHVVDAAGLAPAQEVLDVVGAPPVPLARVHESGDARPSAVAVHDDADVARASRSPCRRPRSSLGHPVRGRLRATCCSGLVDQSTAVRQLGLTLLRVPSPPPRVSLAPSRSEDLMEDDVGQRFAVVVGEPGLIDVSRRGQIWDMSMQSWSPR